MNIVVPFCRSYYFLLQGMKVKKPDNLETDDIIFSMEEPLEKGSVMAMRSASRLALFMMRDDSKESASENVHLQHAQVSMILIFTCFKANTISIVIFFRQDYFVVSSCKVWMKLLEPLPQKKDVSFEAIIKEVDQKSIKANLKRVYDFIEEKSFDGATCGDLTKAFKYDTVLKQLEELIDQHYVFRVGIIQTRFVTKAHIKPWVLKSFDLKRTDREKAGKWTTKGKMTLEQAKSNEVGEYGNVF